MMNDPQPETPIACTLSPGDLKARLAVIAELNSTALRAYTRNDLRLELTYSDTAREQVLAMVRAEQSCCAFLTFEVHDEAGAIRVVVEAPETARDGAEQVFEPFYTKSTRKSACNCC